MKRSLTLIELLVVIAIIGILAGLSVPALSAARESARNTACMNQLSQIGKATVMYHKNNAGYIPGGANSAAGGSRTYKNATDPAYRLMRGGYLTGERKTIDAKDAENYFKCPSDINDEYAKDADKMSYNWFVDYTGSTKRAVIGRDNPNLAIWSDIIQNGTANSGNHPAVTNILYLGGHVRSKELQDGSSAPAALDEN